MPKNKTDDMAKSRGVSLKSSEWKIVDKLAAELNWKPGAVTAYAVRYFLKSWQEGKVKTVTKTTKELPDL